MHQPVCVSVGKARRKLFDDAHRFINGQATGGKRADECIERLALHDLHAHEDGLGALVAVEVVNGGDVRMCESLLLGSLALQCDEGLRMLLEIGLKQLDGDVGITVLGFLLEEVLAFPDRSHAALAELGDELEASSQNLALLKLPLRDVVTVQARPHGAGGLLAAGGDAHVGDGGVGPFRARDCGPLGGRLVHLLAASGHLLFAVTRGRVQLGGSLGLAEAAVHGRGAVVERRALRSSQHCRTVFRNGRELPAQRLVRGFLQAVGTRCLQRHQGVSGGAVGSRHEPVHIGLHGFEIHAAATVGSE